MSDATTETPIGFGPYVRQLRERADLKQRQVAERIGMSQSQYSGIEGNTKPGYIPGPAVVAGLAKVFRVPETDLLRAAGYLQNDIASRRLDDDGDAWIAEQDAIAAALGPMQLEKIFDRVKEQVLEQAFPNRPATQREMSLGGT